MVNHVNFPQNLTEEELILKQKYAILKKKKKALQAIRTAKPEREQPQAAPAKRPAAESAEDAKEQAKKLLKSGSIKIKVDNEKQSFKRSKNQERKLKDPEKTPTAVGFQPFAAAHPDEDDKDGNKSSQRPRMRGLYDSFVSGGYDRDREERREERNQQERRDRDYDLPKKGNTIYVNGLGITEEILRKAFSNIGTILNINMERDKHVGFVTFERMESADTAIAEVNGAMVEGIQLKVTMARRQPSFDQNNDQSTKSWSSIAASNSQKSSYKDKREVVSYDADDIF
ncbi:negative elongation factor E-like [Saccostrea echinata]|uniref:negative elongation factor E-like n=1 Tax=Saccostrea echinata TaxID=191078 RepID=UPI002A808AC4|nr:negative elongation factor E-like [Saccostrea echinata]